jgi:tRNA threonylcarbamoyladenosine biosynthesis protein TsaB
MALLLNIDTATESAVISLSDNETVIDFSANDNQKDHASFLHPAIKLLLQKTGLSLADLSAVAVAEGPGSYTGLRVGMASAKGLCYALNIPMITINTLEVMAFSLIQQTGDNNAYYCPLIDARRMEVFTGVYDHLLAEIIPPCAMVLNNYSFTELLSANRMYFSGSGAPKLEQELKNPNAIFTDHFTTPAAMAALANECFKKGEFADMSYASPVYLKEFYTPAKPPA